MNGLRQIQECQGESLDLCYLLCEQVWAICYMPMSSWYLETDSSQKMSERHFLQTLPACLIYTWGIQHCNSSLGCSYKVWMTPTPGIFSPGTEWQRTQLLPAAADPTPTPCRWMWNRKGRFLSVVKLIYLAEIQSGPFSRYVLPSPPGLKHSNKHTLTQWGRSRHCDSKQPLLGHVCSSLLSDLCNLLSNVQRDLVSFHIANTIKY